MLEFLLLKNQKKTVTFEYRICTLLILQRMQLIHSKLDSIQDVICLMSQAKSCVAPFSKVAVAELTA